MLHVSRYYTRGDHEHDRDGLERPELAPVELQTAVIGFAIGRVLKRYASRLVSGRDDDIRHKLSVFFVNIIQPRFRSACCGGSENKTLEPELYRELQVLDEIGRVDAVLRKMGYEDGLAELLKCHEAKIEAVLRTNGFLLNNGVAGIVTGVRSKAVGE